MGSGRRLALAVAAIALGCDARPLAPSDAGVPDIDAGADRGPSAVPDAGDVRPDQYLPILIYSCGNGVVDPSEQCDDGNHALGDGCSSICQIECRLSCGSCGPAGLCLHLCGDGVLDAGEACDDGNRIAGDGCSADCAAIEPGWRCPLAGRRCAPICGDGRVVGPETCDDDNAIAADGCSAICVSETQTARCGDGMLQGSEECDLGTANADADYGGCTTGCLYGPHCGDGVRSGPEACDLGDSGNDAAYDATSGCARDCRAPHFCGDAIVDFENGEECDFGPYNGEISRCCSVACKILLGC